MSRLVNEGRPAVPTSLPERLTMQEASASLESLRQALQADGSPVWRIDASAVAHLDSAAIAVLLECHRLATASKRGLEVVGAPPRLLALARLYGVDGLIGAAAPAA